MIISCNPPLHCHMQFSMQYLYLCPNLVLDFFRVKTENATQIIYPQHLRIFYDCCDNTEAVYGLFGLYDFCMNALGWEMLSLVFFRSYQGSKCQDMGCICMILTVPRVAKRVDQQQQHCAAEQQSPSWLTLHSAAGPTAAGAAGAAGAGAAAAAGAADCR